MITDRTEFQFSTQTLFEITGQLSAIADHINEVLGEGIDKAYKAGIKAVVTNNVKWLKGSKDKPAFNKFAEDLDITVDPKTGKVVTIKKKKKPLNPLFDVSYTETDMKAIYNFRVEAFTVAQIGEYDLQEDLKGLAEKTVLEHNSDPSYFVKEAQRMANRYIRGDWLETNFNTAVGSSYRAAEWIRLQDPAVKDIYPAYQYKTRGDSRVRDEHRALADKVYRNTDPLWSKVWPPNGWNCRCYAIPLDTDDLSSGQYKVEDMMRSKEEEKAIIDATFKTKDEKKYFARNSGETKSIWGKWINEKFKDMPADVKAEIKGRVKNYAKGLTSEIVKDSGGKVAEAVTEKVVKVIGEVPAKLKSEHDLMLKAISNVESQFKTLGIDSIEYVKSKKAFGAQILEGKKIQVNTTHDIYYSWDEDNKNRLGDITFSAVTKLPRKDVYKNIIVHEAGHSVLNALPFEKRKEFGKIVNSLARSEKSSISLYSQWALKYGSNHVEETFAESLVLYMNESTRQKLPQSILKFIESIAK